jgi:hypothetical protein
VHVPHHRISRSGRRGLTGRLLSQSCRAERALSHASRFAAKRFLEGAAGYRGAARQPVGLNLKVARSDLASRPFDDAHQQQVSTGS